MNIFMSVLYQIQKEVDGKYIPLAKTDVDVSGIMNCEFICGGKPVPFAFGESMGEWKFNTMVLDNSCDLFYPYEDPCDTRYYAPKIRRNKMSAAFLASATEINKFHVSIILNNKKGIGFGNNYEAMESGYRIFLLGIEFSDSEDGPTYSVAQPVLDAFNKGKEAGV